MIRWKYVAPRIALCVLIVTFLLLALNPLLRTSIVRSGQAVTGARVEIDGVRTSLREMRVELEGFRAADPHNGMRNLFEARSVKLDIDSAALCRRQILVRRGQVTGLELGTQRTTSGAVAGVDGSEYANQLAREFEAFGRNWLLQAAENLKRGAAQDLQSVRLAQELCRRWPGEYESLEQESRDLKDRVEALSALLEQAGQNPLRNVASYQQAIMQLESLSREVFQIRSRMERIHQQILMDRDAIATARRNDVEVVQKTLDFGSPGGAQLSEYLLGPEVSQRVRESLSWLKWGRQFLPALAQGPAATGRRGQNVFFRGLEPSPSVLIDTLVLRGTAQLGDEPTSLEGAIRGLSSDPQAYGKPTEIVIQTTGTTPMLVQATLDASGETQRDRLLIDCPRLPQPERMLGMSEQLALRVSPAQIHLWIRLDLEENGLNGEIVLTQKDVEVQSQLANGYGGPEVARLVTAALEEVDHIDASILLGGTMTEPTWTIRSNLGPQLAEGLRRAFAQELVTRREQMVQTAHLEIEQQLGRLEQQLRQGQQSLLKSLEISDVEIERVRRYVASRVDLHDAVVDPESPLREVFQR